MNARDYAWRQLAAARLPGWQFDPKSFRPRNAVPPTDPRDLDLAHALARSVTKNLEQLRHLTQHYSGRTTRQIDPGVQIILAMGLAQLRFFTRLPPYAVVDEAVNQTKRMGFGKAAGFVNAVLRQALREPSPPLPDVNDIQGYAQQVLSHPPVLFRRMSQLMGQEDALLLAQRHNAEAPIIVRGKPPESEGVTVTPHEVDGFFVVSGATERQLAAWGASGVSQVQDPTSAGVIKHLDLAGAKRVLDRCCGVGTKTLQIAKAAPDADIIAIDPAAFRIDALKRSAGDFNITAIVNTKVPFDAAPFDRILVDVPCSNSGVLARRPEARFRQDDATLKSLEELQRTILKETVPHLAPGGLLIYSTCSIWPEENGDQVRWLADTFPQLKVVNVQTTLPSLAPEPTKHHDGGFVAVLNRE